ncbi:f-boxfbd/lrr-repeat protein, partial [Nicotiana attenuata]
KHRGRIVICALLIKMARLLRKNGGSRKKNHYSDGLGRIDRISDLPSNVIDEILCRMTTKEIAQMSVLSKKWYHIWSTHPVIVLDRQFHEDINQDDSSVTYGGFKNIVNKILLQHNGPIVKFFLDLSIADLNDWDIDHWLRYVSNNGVNELTIDNSFQFPYNLPHFLFKCAKLSYLNVTNCNFKLPLASTSFQNLVRLDLKLMSFNQKLAQNILEAPLLLILMITGCDGIQFLNISAPRLLCLHIVDSHYVDLKLLKACPELKVVTIVTCNRIYTYEYWRKFTLFQMIASFPKLTGFCLDGLFFKFVVPTVVPKRLEAPLEHLVVLKLGFCFADKAQISAVICLIQSAPQLHTLEIQEELSDAEDINVDAVTEFLTAPNCVEQDLISLQKIKLEGYVNNTIERHFMKLLLARCPSLVEVIVVPSRFIEYNGIWLFFFELLEFPRASQNVNILLG